MGGLAKKRPRLPKQRKRVQLPDPLQRIAQKVKLGLVEDGIETERGQIQRWRNKEITEVNLIQL